MSNNESSCPSENEVDDTAASPTIATPEAHLPLQTDSDLDSDLRSSLIDHVLVTVCLIVGYTLSISPWLLVLYFCVT